MCKWRIWEVFSLLLGAGNSKASCLVYSCLPRCSVGPEISVQNNLGAEKPGRSISVAMWLMEDVFSSANSSKTAELIQGPGEGKAMSLPGWPSQHPGHQRGWQPLMWAQLTGCRAVASQGLDLGCCRRVCPRVVLPGPQHCSSLSPEPSSPQCLVSQQWGNSWGPTVLLHLIIEREVERKL